MQNDPELKIGDPELIPVKLQDADSAQASSANDIFDNLTPVTLPSVGNDTQDDSSIYDNLIPVDDKDNADPLVSKIRGAKDNHKQLEIVDDEIQSLVTRLSGLKDEYRGKADIRTNYDEPWRNSNGIGLPLPISNKKLAEMQKESFEKNPYAIEKLMIENRLAELKDVRRVVYTRANPKSEEDKDQVINAVSFKRDTAGKWIDDYTQAITKFGESDFKLIDRNTQKEAYDKLVNMDIKNQEAQGRSIGMFSFDALNTELPQFDSYELGRLKNLHKDIINNPEYNGIKRSGNFDYVKKREVADKLVKEYVDANFADLDPEGKKKKRIEYAKRINALMTINDETGSWTIYGLKSASESNMNQLQLRYDEISGIRDAIHKAEFPASGENETPIQDMLGWDGNMEEKYGNFQRYKSFIEQEYKSLDAAMRLNTLILKTEEQKRGVRDIVKSLDNAMLIEDLVSLGITEAKRNTHVVDIANKVKNDIYYEPTYGEQMLLETYSMLQEAQTKGTIGTFAQISHGLTAMLPYVATFSGTTAPYKIGTAITKKGISSASKALLGQMKPSLAKSLSVTMSPKTARIIGKAGQTELNLSSLASKYMSKAGGAAFQSAFLPQYAINNIADRLTPEMTTDFDQEVKDIITSIDRNTIDKTDAILKGASSAYFEILSEHAGTQLMKLAKIPGRTVTQNVRGLDISKKIVLDKYLDLKGYKSFKEGIDKIKKSGIGWHGIKEEYMEELANQAANYATGAERPESLKEFWDTQLVTLGTITMFGGFTNAIGKAAEITRAGLVGNDVVYISTDPKTGKKKPVRLKKEFHDSLMKIYNEGGGEINRQEYSDLMNMWTNRPNKKENLTKEQFKLIFALGEINTHNRFIEGDIISRAEKNGYTIVDKSKPLSDKEVAENAKVLGKEAFEEIKETNKKIYPKYKDLIDNGLMPQDDTGQYIEPEAAFLISVREDLIEQVDRNLEKDKDGKFLHLDDVTKEQISDLEKKKEALDPAADIAEIQDIDSRIENLHKKSIPAEALEAQVKLDVIEDELLKIADREGIGFNSKRPSEKHALLMEAIKTNESITGKADMVTNVKMLVTLPDGRRVNAFVGPRPGVNETKEQYRERRSVIASDILMKKKPVTLKITRKEEWNPENKAMYTRVGPDGNTEYIPYGDRIEVLVGDKMVAAVQISDYGYEDEYKQKYDTAVRVVKENANELLSNIKPKPEGKPDAPIVERKSNVKLISEIAKSIADILEVSISEVIAAMRKMVTELPNINDEEKGRLNDSITKNEKAIIEYIEAERFAKKGWGRAPDWNKLEDIISNIAEETEITARESDAIGADAGRKVDAQLKTFFPLWKGLADASSYSRREYENMFYNIAHLDSFDSVTNDELYKAWLDSLLDGTNQMKNLVDALKMFKFETAVSIFNFYRNTFITKQYGIIIDSNKPSIQLLNRSDKYSELLDKFLKHIEGPDPSPGVSMMQSIKADVIRHRADHDKKFATYRMLTENDPESADTPEFLGKSPEERLKAKQIRLKHEQHELDLDFLERITGIGSDYWRQYFNQKTKETFAFATPDAKEKTDFGTYENLLNSEAYRMPGIDRKSGQPNRWFQSDLIFQLTKGTASPTSKGEGRTTEEYRRIFRDFFTLGNEARNVKSNLYKLSTSIEGENAVGTHGKNVKGDRFSSLVQYSDIFGSADNILSSNIDNPLVRYYKSLGKKMEISILNGLHNRDIKSRRKGNTSDAMSMEDLWVSMMVMYAQGAETYMHNIGQFSDKPTIYMIDAIKYGSITPEQEAFVTEALGGKENVEKIKNDIKRNIIALNEKLISKAIGIERPAGDTKFAAYDEFVSLFLSNHVLNTRDSNQIFFGEFDSYKKWYNAKEGVAPKYTDLVKRAGSGNSPGYRLNTRIEGGVGESFNFVVANELSINLEKYGIKVDESLDGMIFMSDAFARKVQTSMGTIYSKIAKYPVLNSLKAIMSFKHDDTNMRELTKANIINIGVLADPLKEISPLFSEIHEFMKRNNIDMLSLPSSSKIHSGSEVFNLFDENGNVIKDATIDVTRNLEVRRSDTLVVQQDLRHDTTPKTTSMPSQFLTNMLTLGNSSEIIANIIEIRNKGLERLSRSLQGDNATKLKFLKGKISEYTQADLKAFLEKGLTLQDPAYKNFMHQALASSLADLALDIPVSRVTTQEIADASGILKPLRPTADGKHMLLPEIITGIPGAREEKFHAMSLEKAYAFITLNAEKYADLLDSPWEIQEVIDENGKVKGVIIPGEVIISTRVPADGLHSHTVARLKKNLVDHNFTMLDRVSQLASGSDFDGDYRFNQVMFRQSKKREQEKENDARFGLETEYNVQDLMNEIMSYVIQAYTDPANARKITQPIDTKKYDKIVEKIRTDSEQGKHPYDILSYFDSRLKNIVGVKMKGIMTDHMTNFSLLSKYRTNLKNRLNISFGDNKARFLNIDQIASDNHGVIKAHLSNLLNLSFDNAKDPKIEILGLNEITANMYVMSLICDSRNSSEGKTYEQQDLAVMNSIENLSEYFTSPMVRRYVELKRKQGGGLKVLTDESIRATMISEFDEQEVKNLYSLWYASNELKDMRTLYRLTQEGPESYTEYIEARHVVRKMRIMDADQGGMRYFNTKNFFVTEKDSTGKFVSVFIPELRVVEDVLRFARENVFNDLIEESEPGKQIFKYLFGILKRTKPKKTVLNKDEILKFSNALNRVFVIKALGLNKNAFQVRRDAMNIHKAIFGEVSSSLTDTQKKAIEKEIDPLRKNEFVNFIKLIETDKGMQQLSIIPDYMLASIPEDKVERIRQDFDKLPVYMQDAYAAYTIYFHGATNSNNRGGFFNLLGNDYRVALSEKMSLENQRWTDNTLSPIEKMNTTMWMIKSMGNEELRDSEPGISHSDVVDYYNDPLVREPINPDALEALESIEGETNKEVLDKYVNILDEYGMKVGGKYFLKKWAIDVLGLNEASIAADDPAWSISGKIPEMMAKAIKTYKSQRESRANSLFPKHDSGEAAVRNMTEGDRYTGLMLSKDTAIQDRIYSRLKEKYPELLLFRSRDVFYEYVRVNGGRLRDVNMTAIGHAFKNAIFIEENSSSQVAMFHEMGHIYWDHLPVGSKSKKLLRDLYREQYPATDFGIDELDEMIISDIGYYGTKSSSIYIHGNLFDRFIESLKDFWREVKAFFGKYSKDDLLNGIVRDIYFNSDNIDLATAEGAVEIRNLVTYNDDMISVERKGRTSIMLNDTPIHGITQEISRLEKSKYDPNERLSDYIDRFTIDFRKNMGREPNREEVESEMEGFKIKGELDAQAGTDIHAVAEYVFGDKPLSSSLREIEAGLLSRFASPEAVKEYIKSMHGLKQSLIKKYQIDYNKETIDKKLDRPERNISFITEKDIISAKYGLFSIVDMIVDLGDGHVLVFDFKTTEKEFLDKDGNPSESYKKGYGTMKNPAHDLAQSKYNKHALQLTIEAIFIEEQHNTALKGQKNIVDDLFIVPIIREIDEKGVIQKARISIINGIPGEDTSDPLQNCVNIPYTKDGMFRKNAINILEASKSRRAELANSLPELDNKLKKQGYVSTIRRDMLKAYSYLSAMSNVPLGQITHKTMEDIRNNGIGVRYFKFLELGYDANDFETIPFEYFLNIVRTGVKKSDFMSNRGAYVQERTIGYRTVRSENPDLTEEQRNRLYYHTKIGNEDIYCHEVGVSSKELVEGAPVVVISEMQRTRKYRSVEYYTVEKVNKKRGIVRLINNVTKEPRIIEGVKERVGILIHDKEKDSLRHIKENNFVQQLLSTEVPIIEEHWKHAVSTEKIDDFEKDERRIWAFFREYPDKKSVLELVNDYDETKELYNKLSGGEQQTGATDFLKEFLGEILVNHDMAEQIRAEHQSGNTGMMPMTLNIYYMLTLDNKKLFDDFSGFWKYGRYWQPSRMMKGDYIPFNYLMYGVERDFRKQTEHITRLRLSLEKFLELDRVENEDFDLRNLTHTSGKRTFWLLPSNKRLSALEKEYLTIIYEHNYKYVDKYKTALKTMGEGKNGEYPMMVSVTDVFATEQELKTRFGSWGSVFKDIMQPSIFDDTRVQLVEKVGDAFVEIPGKYLKWRDIKEEFAKMQQDEEDLGEWLGKRARFRFRHLPILRTIKSRNGKLFTPGKLYYYFNEAKHNYNTGHGEGNKKPSEKRRAVTSMQNLKPIYKTKYIIESELKVMESNLFAFYMRRRMAPIDYMLSQYKIFSGERAGKYIEEYTDVNIYKRGKSLGKEITALISFFNKTNSLAKIAWSPKTNFYNVVIGQAMDMIREPKAYAVGMNRTLRNTKKAAAIVKRFGVATIVDEAAFDNLEKSGGINFGMKGKNDNGVSFEKIAEAGYSFMDYAEKMNQIPVFTGLMTEDEWNAYDDDGNIIDPSRNMGMSDARVSFITNAVQSIHGDYGMINAAPAWNTAIGSALMQFKKFIPTIVFEEFAPYHFDKNWMVHSGIAPALMLYAKYIKFNYLSSEKTRHERYIKAITERWPDMEKAKLEGVEKTTMYKMKEKIKKDGERTTYEIKGLADYFDMMIAARNQGKLSWTEDLSENDRKKIVAGILQLSATIAMQIAILALMGGGEDKKKFEQINKSFWATFLTRFNGDMTMYLYPLTFTDFSTTAFIASMDAVLNMGRFSVHLSQYIAENSINFVKTWDDDGFKAALETGFIADKSVFSKDGSMPEGTPRFVKDMLGFIPAGGMFKSIISLHQRIKDNTAIQKTLQRKGYSQPYIDYIMEVENISPGMTWKQHREDSEKWRAWESAEKKALLYEALINQDIEDEYRDINQFMRDFKSFTDRNNDALSYQAMIDMFTSDPEYVEWVFSNASKYDNEMNQFKSLSPKKERKKLERAMKKFE
jgi:hypothetical protein